MSHASPPANRAPTSGAALTIGRNALFWGYWSILAAVLAGYLTSVRPNQSPNDNSRWNTVWSLVEHGTYQIFDTPEEAAKHEKPEQYATIDKVHKDGKFYSSKPPFLPTVIAGFVLALKQVFHEPFSKDTKAPDGQSLRGSIHVYGNATLLAFNLVPFLIFLWLFRRFLDRLGVDDFAWCYCLLAAGLGTLATGYLATLNNHTQAFSFGFIALYHLVRIWYDGERQWWRFALAGLALGWTAANELPAGVFVLVALLVVCIADWKRTLIGFLPALGLVTAGFFYTNYLALGSWNPAYVQKELYDYPGSYWKMAASAAPVGATAVPGGPAPSGKSGIDALNEQPESLSVYLLHMTVGHHGVFSLTPIWMFAAWGAARSLTGRDRRLPGIVIPILLVTAVVFAFYWLVNDQRNYGGFCHGMRWLIWLGCLWLAILPTGVDGPALGRFGRWFAWLCLALSVFSAAETLYQPWYRSWVHHLFIAGGVIDY